MTFNQVMIPMPHKKMAPKKGKKGKKPMAKKMKAGKINKKKMAAKKVIGKKAISTKMVAGKKGISTKMVTGKKAQELNKNGKPKRKPTAYLNFVNRNRSAIKRKLGGHPPVTEVTKTAGKMWQKLSDTSKAKWK